MVQKYRFGKERYIKKMNNIQEWQKRRRNSTVRWKKVMSAFIERSLRMKIVQKNWKIVVLAYLLYLKTNIKYVCKQTQ